MNPDAAGFLTSQGADTLLVIRLTPRGGRDAIDGVARLSDGRAVLAVRVRALPEDGAANTALEVLIAQELGLPQRVVTLVGGATSRLKTIRVRAAYQEVWERLVHRGLVPQG